MTGDSAPAAPALTLPSRYWEFHFARDVEFPPVQWRVPDLLSVGLTVLVAPPKIGKTWLSMQIEHFLTRGRPLFGHKPERLMDTLALDLEGNVRRTQTRSWVLHPDLRDDPAAARDTFYIHAADAAFQATPTGAPADRIAWLGAELDAAEAYGHPVGHVRIDTLRLFLGSRPRDMNAYDYDALVGRLLDEFAHQRGISVLAVHHTKKQAGESDWLERVSGSTGIAGSASGIWLLDRARGSDEGVLMATLRDGDEFERAVRFARGRWSFAEDITPTQAKHAPGGGPRAVLDVLHRRIVATFAELAEATGIEQRTLTKTLGRLRDEGTVESAGGRWRLVEAIPDDAPTLDEVAPAEADVQADDAPAEAEADDGPNVAIPALVSSVEAARGHTVPIIRRTDRDAAPWSLRDEWQIGRHSWINEDTVAQLADAGGWDVVVLDRRAAYPSAMSAVPVATSTLVHTGNDAYDRDRAGVYLVEPVTWPVAGRPHPLGLTGGDDVPVWITAPHMELLTKRGVAPVVLDSWTGRRSTALFERFYRWARDARESAGDDVAEVKRQTNVAIRSLWPVKNDGRGRIWRPDWWVAVVAEANVRHWVKADAALADNVAVVALRQTDEAVVAIPSDTANDHATIADVVAPFRVQADDDTGPGYGCVRVKVRMPVRQWVEQGYRNKPRPARHG